MGSQRSVKVQGLDDVLSIMLRVKFKQKYSSRIAGHIRVCVVQFSDFEGHVADTSNTFGTSLPDVFRTPVRTQFFHHACKS